MKKSIIKIRIFQVVVGFVAFGLPLSARSHQDSLSLTNVNSALHNLLDQNFLPKNPEHHTDICNVAAFCNPATQMENLAEIEALHFSSFKPVIVTDSRAQLLRKLKAVSACHGLGVISEIRATLYEADSPAYELFRPTGEFALYQLPLAEHRYIVIRAGGYVDTEEAVNDPSFTDKGDDIKDSWEPPANIKVRDTSGLVNIIDPAQCKLVKRVPYESSSTFDAKTDQSKDANEDAWTAIPIRFKGKDYLLNVSWSREVGLNNERYEAFLILTSLDAPLMLSAKFYTSEKEIK